MAVYVSELVIFCAERGRHTRSRHIAFTAQRIFTFFHKKWALNNYIQRIVHMFDLRIFTVPSMGHFILYYFYGVKKLFRTARKNRSNNKM